MTGVGVSTGRRGGRPRVAVVGGGIVGLACAIALRRAGAEVSLLDRGPGAPAGASPRAAGILGAQLEARGPGPLAELCLASRARYAAFVHELEIASGIVTGHRASGALRVAPRTADLDALDRACAWQRDRGLRAARLDRAEARAIEPALGEAIAGAMHFPDDALVDPPSLVRAARGAAIALGVELRDDVDVIAVEARAGRITGVRAAEGPLPFDRVVVAAGSWSQLLEGSAVAPSAIAPARGQMIELRVEAPLAAVVQGDRAYLSPRADGRVLVGSTLEFVGHRAGNTAGAVADLLADAIAIAPRLAGAEVSQLWSSFRPYAPDELPLIGATLVEGLLVATGHYRNGVLLAPITGDVIAALATGAQPPSDFEALAPAFAPTRFSQPPVRTSA